MAEFFVIKNESIHVANIGYAVWNPAEHGLDGNIIVHAGGRVFSVGFTDPEAPRVADFVGFGDRLAALKKARVEAAEARELAELEKATAPKPATPTRPAGRPLARV